MELSGRFKHKVHVRLIIETSEPFLPLAEIIILFVLATALRKIAVMIQQDK